MAKVKGKVKVKVTDVSQFFGASIVSLRPVMLQMWGPLWVRNIWYRNNHKYELPQSPMLLAVYIWRHGVVHGTLWVTSRRSQQHSNS